MGRLAEILDVSMSSATGIIDRMEERGLVERTRVPDDRRVVMVRPTAGRPRLVDEVELVSDDLLRDPSASRRSTSSGRSRARPPTSAPPSKWPPRAEPGSPRRPSTAPHDRIQHCRARAPRPPPTTEKGLRTMEAFAGRTGGSTSRPSPKTPPSDLTHRAKMEILFAILLGLFLGALDQTIVAVRAAHASSPTSAGNAADLDDHDLPAHVARSRVPFYGKLSDLYGRKPMLMIGITIFLIGSALSGLSQNMTQLIIFRGIQGLGAGALFPIASPSSATCSPPGARQVPGPVRRRVRHRGHHRPAPRRLPDRELVSWHWIFFVNIPIGIVALVVIARLLPTVKRTPRPQLRLPRRRGVHGRHRRVPLVGLTNKQTNPWADPSGRRPHHRRLVLWGVFVFIESRRQGADRPARPVEGPDVRVLHRRRRSSRALRVLRRRSSSCRVVPVRRGRHAHLLGPLHAGALAGLIIGSVGIRDHGVPDRASTSG